MINEAVRKIMESSEWYDEDILCRLPYLVKIKFSDHAISQEYDRQISEADVMQDAKAVISDIIKSFHNREIQENTRFKIINKETCLVSIATIRTNQGGNRVRTLNIITSYIWDGRYNLSGDKKFYATEDESPKWREAVKWNEENQDKVEEFTDWKHDTDLERLKRKADKEYYWRNHPHEMSYDAKMEKGYGKKERADRRDIHNSLPDGDLQAIRDYFKYFDRRQLSSMDSANKELWYDDMKRKEREAAAAKLSEMVNRAVKQAISEAVRRKGPRTHARG